MHCTKLFSAKGPMHALAVIFCLFLSPLAVQASSLDCANGMYREALLSLAENGDFKIQDSEVDGRSMLESALASALNLKPDIELNVSWVRLELAQLNCNLTATLSCHATEAPGAIEVLAYINRNGIWGRVNLRRAVTVHNFEISTAEATPGELSVHAEAQIEFGANQIKLIWKPFFYLGARATPEVFCKKL